MLIAGPLIALITIVAVAAALHRYAASSEHCVICHRPLIREFGKPPRCPVHG